MNRLRLGGLICCLCLALAPALSAEPPQKHEGEVPGDPDFGPPPPALGATPCRNGHADIYPCKYPFFPSGHVVVSGISQGLYILKPTKQVR